MSSDQSYRQIPLSKERFALVDEADYEWLSQWNWHAAWYPKSKAWYAQRYLWSAGRETVISMHRTILGCTHGDGKKVDHRNHNGLDNRRSNLRIATHAQNMQNRKTPITNSSGIRGVRPYKGSWRAQIGCEGKQLHLGTFKTPEEAYQAYCEAARRLHGEFANV